MTSSWYKRLDELGGGPWWRVADTHINPWLLNITDLMTRQIYMSLRRDIPSELGGRIRNSKLEGRLRVGVIKYVEYFA